MSENLKNTPVSDVFNCDCMKYLKTIPDKYFDLAVVDPPYFSGPELREFYGKSANDNGVNKRYRKHEKWKVPTSRYFKELERVSKQYIVFGCNYYRYLFAPGRIVWDKCNGASFLSDCEIAATNLFDSVRMFRFMWNGMMQGKSLTEGHIMQGDKSKNEIRIHPTQKPVALYAWIFQNFAKEGYKILDTHLGSGSSRIAAYHLGLDFFGCEIDKTYFEAANERFEKECHGIERFNKQIVTQQSLF